METVPKIGTVCVGGCVGKGAIFIEVIECTEMFTKKAFFQSLLKIFYCDITPFCFFNTDYTCPEIQQGRYKSGKRHYEHHTTLPTF